MSHHREGCIPSHSPSPVLVGAQSGVPPPPPQDLDKCNCKVRCIFLEIATPCTFGKLQPALHLTCVKKSGTNDNSSLIAALFVQLKILLEVNFSLQGQRTQRTCCSQSSKGLLTSQIPLLRRPALLFFQNWWSSGVSLRFYHDNLGFLRPHATWCLLSNMTVFTVVSGGTKSGLHPKLPFACIVGAQK